jgi:hypothetical protein
VKRTVVLRRHLIFRISFASVFVMIPLWNFRTSPQLTQNPGY